MRKADFPRSRVPLLLLCLLLALHSRAEVMVSGDADWRYLKGAAEASAPTSAWRSLEFEDSTWPVGKGPFYYEDATGYTGNTALTDMRGGYRCVFLRKNFNISNPAAIGELTLFLQVDDGCVVWLNGNEVARVDMADGEPLISWVAASTAGEPDIQTITISNGASVLRAGVNVLAVQAFNSGLSDSTDFLISVSLSGDFDVQRPSVQSVVPAPNNIVRSLEQIEVVFDENVSGVDAGDLLINGAPASDLAVISPREYSFKFPQPATGMVSVAFAPEHGIVDLAVPPNALLPSSWSYDLNPSAPVADVVISEFMADNENGLRDDFGVRSDWIELFNRSANPAELDGFYLTDDPSSPTKWRIPAVTIPARQFLLVWASERNLANPLAPLHTNFKLSADGEYLALCDPGGNVLSDFAPAYPPQGADVSYGRDQTSPTFTGYYVTPTPGSPNTTMGDGFAPEPVFSRSGGLFPNSSLSITLSAASGTIRYTTDGTRPTASSPVYAGAITITSSTVLQARVFQAGLLPSAIVAHTYTLLGSSAGAFSSNLPFLILNTSGRGVAQESRTSASITVIAPYRGRGSMATSPEFIENCQIEVRGQSSTGFPKLGYNLEIDDVNGNDLPVPLLGLPSESDWVLYNPYSDKSFLQNFLAYELHEKMGHYSPRRVFVEVFVDTTGGKLDYPGDYQGIYILVEKIKVDEHRVDIARLGTGQNSEPDITGGYIVKKDKDSPGDYNFSTQGGAGFSSQALKLHEPKPREATLSQKTWIRNYLVHFEKALYASNWLTATGTNHYSHYIDADSFVDYHWIVEFPKQIDGYRLSNYMSKDRGGKLKMEPIWDWNLSLGNADYLEGEFTSGWYYTLCTENEHIWLRRLMCGTTTSSGTTGDPNFNQKIVDRWSVLRTNIFSSTNLLLRIDEMAAYLREAQARDFAKWPRLGTYVWPNPPLYATPTTYTGIISNLKNWVRNRYTWIDSQFLRTPVLSHAPGGVSPGFNLLITAPAGSIYFTTDGTDPRASGGGLASSARFYSSGLLIQTNAHVVARARSGTRWSGPVSGIYVVETPALTLTEIMYSPAPTPGVATNDAPQFEYLELLNSGNETLDLRGYNFTDGILFSFATGAVTSLPPGERLVVARDPAALASRYPNLTKVTGPYSGALANEGEKLRLLGPMQETVLDLSFRAWYPSTDGLGFALVPISEGAVTSDPDASGWRPGTVLGGTPGLPEPPSPGFPRVVINEVLTHTDPPLSGTIELLNAGDTEADIGGWFLSDKRDKPKYAIPAGTLLAPGACYVVTEADFNPIPGVPPSFTLSAAGEEVFLFSADRAGELTGYAHGFEFGPALNGVSFGRYVTSTGKEEFVAQASRTVGMPNTAPRVGPIVISEIHYRPPDAFANNAYWDNTEDEFIELSNIAPVTVGLFDADAVTNTWRLRDAVEYQFPANQTMNPGERVLVVSFDPTRDLAAAADFRSRFSLPQSVRLFGPFSGKLANKGDSVELIQPDSLMVSPTNITVTSVLADKVEYHDDLPWPAGPDGLGFSLQRRVETAYGNDPANWVAAAPTPATELGTTAEPIITLNPADLLLRPGETAVLQVSASHSETLLYQWRFDGENLPGAVSPILTLTNVQPAQSGVYEVIVFSSSRAMTSAAARLIVNAGPIIQQNPVPVDAAPGDEVTFSVVAYGASPLRYQWRHDGSPIAGAAGSSLRIVDAESTAEGNYDVVVSDSAGVSSTSSSARLVLTGKPSIVRQPSNLIVLAGATAAFDVAVTNTAALPITFVWFKDDTIVASRTVTAYADSLVLDNVLTNASGTYMVRVANNSVGQPGYASQTASLTVLQDTDKDGVPDDWELAHGFNPADPSDGAGDADSDGASNLAEYLAGTDPADRGSVLRVEPLDISDDVVIRFNGLTARSYSLLFCTQLEPRLWTVLTNIPAISGGDVEMRRIEVFDRQPPGESQRYYRIQTPAASGQ